MSNPHHVKRYGNMGRFFSRFSEKASDWSGSPIAFAMALFIVMAWALTGPIFHFSEIWQLVINTGTTIVTFLLVFLIQNSQNRDMRAVQLKLDELLRVTEGAHTVLLDIEKLTPGELGKICERYSILAQQARQRLREGGIDTGVPEVQIDAREE